MHLPRGWRPVPSPPDLLLVRWNEQRSVEVDGAQRLNKEAQMVLLQRLARSLLRNDEDPMPRPRPRDPRWASRGAMRQLSAPTANTVEAPFPHSPRRDPGSVASSPPDMPAIRTETDKTPVTLVTRYPKWSVVPHPRHLARDRSVIVYGSGVQPGRRGGAPRPATVRVHRTEAAGAGDPIFWGEASSGWPGQLPSARTRQLTSQARTKGKHPCAPSAIKVAIVRPATLPCTSPARPRVPRLLLCRWWA